MENWLFDEIKSRATITSCKFLLFSEVNGMFIKLQWTETFRKLNIMKENFLGSEV